MADDPYVYPGTRTLRNRYGVRDPAELARVEAEVTYARLYELGQHSLPGAYDLAHLQAFHRRIFGDIYDWAGEIRSVTIAKGDLFALPQHIEPYLTDVGHLHFENYLRGLEGDRLVDRLTHYLAEINATHPFRDGNGRTQRAFIGQLASAAGYTIDWQRLDPARNIEVSRAAHRGATSRCAPCSPTSSVQPDSRHDARTQLAVTTGERFSRARDPEPARPDGSAVRLVERLLQLLAQLAEC